MQPDVINKTEDDNVPTLICDACTNDLKSAYLFLLKYEQAVNIIRNYLSTTTTRCLGIKKCDEGEESNDFGVEEEENEATFVAVPAPYATRHATKQRLVAIKQRKKQRKKKPNIIVNEDIEEDFTAELDNDKEITVPQPELHNCPICTKQFTAVALRSHAHSHKALKNYLNIPQEARVSATAKFYATRQIDYPRVSIFNRSDKRHKCPYCNRLFAVHEFRAHTEDHRNANEFKCDQCDRVFKRVNHLNTHRVKHLQEFPYRCEQCGKGFVIATNYECHMLTHTNGELPHECKYCLRRFSNPEHLNRHQIIHTENVTYSVKYRVCRCHHCLRTFRDKAELQGHVCVPVKQPANTRFPCHTCNKVFTHSSNLYTHNRNIHKLKGAKTLCSVCGNYVSNIYNHMMRHTGEKPFKCNQCEKRFIAKPQLKQHLLVHSGLKPFVCSVCAKAFNNLYNLQVHERIHKGDRCHICTICNKGFLEKSYLKKHMAVHSKA